VALTPGHLPIQNPSVTDRKADTTVHTTVEGIVHREVLNIGSPDDTRTANRAEVLGADPASGDMGLVVRPTPGTAAIGRLTGTVSTANSTSTPLGIGAAFTGTFEEVKDYGAISVIVFADVASANDGLEFQWSSDGTNGDRIEGSSVVAATGRAFALSPRARYFRIRYVNGGTGQATFRLGTTFHPAGSGLISRALDQALNDENFAQTVRACLDAQDPSSTDFEHVNAMASAPAGTERGLVTRNIPSGTQAVDPTDEPTRDNGKVDVAALDQYTPVSGRLPVDGSGVTQPISGSVNQGSPGSAWEVVGDVAHDVAAPANPVVIGGQMETPADSAPGTRAGTDGDATKLASLDGAQYVVQGGPQQWSYHENSSSALTDTSVHGTPGVGLSLYVCTVVFSTGAATAWNIFFEEGAATVLGPWYLEAVAGRGGVIKFDPPKKITANTALTVTTSAAIAHSIDMTGFVAPG